MKVKLRASTIRRMLARKNQSQNAMAGWFNLSSGYVSQLMTGSRSPSPELRKKFMEKFTEYTFDDLFVIKGR